MIRWCGNDGGGSAGAPCSFSVLFPFSERKAVEEDDVGASTSPVDCTLSLGTPYTRPQSSAMQRSSPVSSFTWDKLTQSEKCSSEATARGGSSVSGGDPFLLARRCANCDTTSTPLWRNGPRGPKSLCNACGIRYKKEERRAAASSANSSMTVQGVGESISYLYPRGQQQHPWGCYAPAASTDSTAKRSVLSMYAGEADQDQKEGFLPWRLSVVPPQFPAGDRGGLFQYQ